MTADHPLVRDLPVVKALANGAGSSVAVVDDPLAESLPTAGASAGAGSGGGEVDLDPLSAMLLAETRSSAPVRYHALPSTFPCEAVLLVLQLSVHVTGVCFVVGFVTTCRHQSARKDLDYTDTTDPGEVRQSGRVVWNLWVQKRRQIQSEFTSSGVVNVTAVRAVASRYHWEVPCK